MLRIITLAFICADLVAQTSAIRTYCNPIDVDYKYNFEQLNERISYRHGADPVIVNHKGEYFLFATVVGGWWHSTDLANWRFVEPSKWPVEDIVAPAAISYGDAIYLFQSNFEHRPIFFTREPKTGKLDYFNRWMPLMPGAHGPWDPDFFRDPDSGIWYMYFGSSNLFPVYGIALDYNKKLTYVGSAKPLLVLEPEKYGWERFGEDHRDPRRPYIEGATMTKYNGKYYFQYAAPGTEYNVYANGVAIGDNPLGPFTRAPYNPLSYKPGGFVTGAGHGGTFQDNYGNYWNTGTPWIGVNWNFERRMAMFPAGFDRDAQMFSNTRFGDFPHYLPTRKWTNKDGLFTGWMLLSYRKPATASSTYQDFVAANLTDENPRTFWVAASKKAGESLTLDLESVHEIRALQVNYADYKSEVYDRGPHVYTQFRMHASVDGQRWQKIADLTGEKRDRPNAYIELAQPVKARYVKYEHVYVAAANLAISDIRLFGRGSGKGPSTPAKLSVERDTDQRNAFIRWEHVPDAVGYNILWGIAPDKLCQTYQRFADQASTLELRALTVDQKYYFAIEAFNQNGVSPPSEVIGPR